MRILITVASYFPSKDGVQFVTSYLAEELAHRGHLVHIVTNEYEGFRCSDEVLNGVAITRFSTFTAHMIHKGDKQAYLDYILANCKQYDAIINVSTQAPFTDWILPIMDQIHIPKVLHLHSIWKFAISKNDFSQCKTLVAKLFGNLRWGLYYARYASAFKKYDAVLQLHKEDPACRFFKLFYGIDSFVLENAVEESFFCHDGIQKKKTIVYVANYMKGKNQKRCVDLFMRSGISEDWTLLLLGSKESAYYHELRSYCQQHYPDALDKRIQLLVGVDRSKLCEMVKESSLFMMTSLVEAFPISIIEAMAAKVPYISTDVGIVKHLNGGVVAHSDEEFIKYLKMYTQDDVAREQLAQRAYNEALLHYRIEDKVDQLEKLLLGLCGH